VDGWASLACKLIIALKCLMPGFQIKERYLKARQLASNESINVGVRWWETPLLPAKFEHLWMLQISSWHHWRLGKLSDISTYNVQDRRCVRILAIYSLFIRGRRPPLVASGFENIYIISVHLLHNFLNDRRCYIKASINGALVRLIGSRSCINRSLEFSWNP
jgi:hypothetical protein